MAARYGGGRFQVTQLQNAILPLRLAVECGPGVEMSIASMATLKCNGENTVAAILVITKAFSPRSASAKSR